MFTGTVKWFNNTKGFGFVVPDTQTTDGQEHNAQPAEARDVFAHYSEINMDGYKALKAGQRVAFDIKAGDKGEQAVNIRPITNLESNTCTSEDEVNLTTAAGTETNVSHKNADAQLASEVEPA